MSSFAHSIKKSLSEEEFVRFEFTSRGHVEVTGLVREYGNFDRLLRFGFEADQSFISPFLDSLESAVTDLNR